MVKSGLKLSLCIIHMGLGHSREEGYLGNLKLYVVMWIFFFSLSLGLFKRLKGKLKHIDCGHT